MKTKYTTKEIYLTQGQVEKLSAAIVKSRSVSLKISPETASPATKSPTTESLTTSNKTAVKVMLTQQQINKLNRGKPLVLKLSVAQVTAMANRYAVDSSFLGPALATIAKKVIPKIVPVLGTLGLASASGAVSEATPKK